MAKISLGDIRCYALYLAISAFQTLIWSINRSNRKICSSQSLSSNELHQILHSKHFKSKDMFIFDSFHCGLGFVFDWFVFWFVWFWLAIFRLKSYNDSRRTSLIKSNRMIGPSINQSINQSNQSVNVTSHQNCDECNTASRILTQQHKYTKINRAISIFGNFLRVYSPEHGYSRVIRMR